MTVVNEPGLYSLILTSRKSEAKQFKRWITHEVIPSIRKTGAYATTPLPEYQSEPIRAAMEMFRSVDVMSMKVTDRTALFKTISNAFINDRQARPRRTVPVTPSVPSVPGAPGLPVSIDTETQAAREANADKLLAWLRDEYAKQGDKLGIIQDEWLVVYRIDLSLWAKRRRLNLTILLRELHRRGAVKKFFLGGKLRYSVRKRIDGRLTEQVWINREVAGVGEVS